MGNSLGRFHWALLSACFAALTAIFAKLGLQRIDSDFATLVRTVVIAVVFAVFVAATGKMANPLALPRSTLGFLVLPALATGASWVCYFRALQIGDASQVAAGGGVRRHLPARTPASARMAGHRTGRHRRIDPGFQALARAPGAWRRLRRRHPHTSLQATCHGPGEAP